VAEEIIYEYKIEYSKSSIIADVILGTFILVGGLASTFLIRKWIFLWVVLIGLFILWKAIKRSFKQGPQLMIGRAGIWTAATGHLPWSEAVPAFKINTGSRNPTTCFVILNRQSQHIELASFNPEDLDVDSRSLKVYLNEFSPQKVETIVKSGP
jgi:hypothetical protein